MIHYPRFLLVTLTAFCAILAGTAQLPAQENNFQLSFYQLELRPNLSEESIEAIAELHLLFLKPATTLELVLQQALTIKSCQLDGREIDYERLGKIIKLALPYPITENSLHTLEIGFQGQPDQSDNPPWQPGFHYSLDHKDRSWLTVCGGKGAGTEWMPHFPGVRADSLSVSIITPERLMAVANGQLLNAETDEDAAKTTYQFHHNYPALPTQISWGLGYFALVDTFFRQIDGSEYPLRHYVIDYNSNRARKHFQQTVKAFAAWEHYLGPPPFQQQGMLLLETPYESFTVPGLIGYGNRFMRGAYGGFIPRNMDWDHALVRQTARMYVEDRFPTVSANDRWLLEGFTTYLESLFVEFHYGKTAAMAYLEIYRPYLRDRQPLVDPLATDLDLNDAEFQAKGAFFLHTLRTTLQDDGAWFSLLRDFFIEDFPAANQSLALRSHLEAGSGLELTALFQHFMQERGLPVIELKYAPKQGKNEVLYRLQPGQRQLPLTVELFLAAGNELRIHPDLEQWQSFSAPANFELSALRLKAGAAAVRLLKVKD